VLELAVSIGLFLAGCAAMYLAYPVSYLLTLALAIPTGAMLVRVFIIQHDCGHGAFFASRSLNNAVGRLCGVLTFTPYANWRRHHAQHHGNWNNLDRRDAGADIYSSCLTVKEYRALSRWQRLGHRLARHPFVANVLLPPAVFVLLYRVPFDTPRTWWRERRSVYGTNLAIAALIATLGLLIGFEQVLLVQLPIIVVASIIGVWLFASQHRFEGTLWMRQPDWTFADAALLGSSYLRLPRWLQWLTGNIGFHHVHHLSPRVPNYRLQGCHEAVPQLREVPARSMGSSLRGMRLALWDEDHQRLVSFADARA
jgi:omega-6 fatty acid desaturase (delta-12 desaturase)